MNTQKNIIITRSEAEEISSFLYMRSKELEETYTSLEIGMPDEELDMLVEQIHSIQRMHKKYSDIFTELDNC